MNVPPQRGRGECRVPVAPAASRVEKNTQLVTTDTPVHPAFPHAMVLTVSFALSPVIGLCCHRRLADTSARLERQRRGVRTTRLRRPQEALSSKAPPASTASRPAFVTIASRPSVGRDGEVLELILATAKAEYFSLQGWTLTDPARVLICPTGMCVRRSAVQRAPAVCRDAGCCTSFQCDQVLDARS